MDIYAPLAERIGMEAVKTELEDLAFAELNPSALKSVKRRLSFLRSQDEDLVNRILKTLETLLIFEEVYLFSIPLSIILYKKQMYQ